MNLTSCSEFMSESDPLAKNCTEFQWGSKLPGTSSEALIIGNSRLTYLSEIGIVHGTTQLSIMGNKLSLSIMGNSYLSEIGIVHGTTQLSIMGNWHVPVGILYVA